METFRPHPLICRGSPQGRPGVGSLKLGSLNPGIRVLASRIRRIVLFARAGRSDRRPARIISIKHHTQPRNVVCRTHRCTEVFCGKTLTSRSVHVWRIRIKLSTIQEHCTEVLACACRKATWQQAVATLERSVSDVQTPFSFGNALAGRSAHVAQNHHIVNSPQKQH